MSLTWSGPGKSRVYVIDDSPKFHDVGWTERKPERVFKHWILAGLVFVALAYVWLEVARNL